MAKQMLSTLQTAISFLTLFLLLTIWNTCSADMTPGFVFKVCRQMSLGKSYFHRNGRWSDLPLGFSLVVYPAIRPMATLWENWRKVNEDFEVAGDSRNSLYSLYLCISSILKNILLGHFKDVLENIVLYRLVALVDTSHIWCVVSHNLRTRYGLERTACSSTCTGLSTSVIVSCEL